MTASALVIDSDGRFLLQQRDNIPGIVLPGRIGLFGGHLEKDETFLQCVARELHEELSFFCPDERFEHLVSYSTEASDSEIGMAHAEIFVVYDVPVEGLRITEGGLVIADSREVAYVANLTHSARRALNAHSQRARHGANETNARLPHMLRADAQRYIKDRLPDPTAIVHLLGPFGHPQAFVVEVPGQKLEIQKVAEDVFFKLLKTHWIVGRHQAPTDARLP